MHVTRLRIGRGLGLVTLETYKVSEYAKLRIGRGLGLVTLPKRKRGIPFYLAVADWSRAGIGYTWHQALQDTTNR